MRITTAAQAAECDAAAIASGIDSWALMHAAGSAAAQFIAGIATEANAPAVFVWAGPGNNGGDAYVVAAELLHNGFNVVLRATGEPRTPDAIRARDLYVETRDAQTAHKSGEGDTTEAVEDDDGADAADEGFHFVFVDGLLGTGQQGALRKPERELTSQLARFRADGGIVIALDVPTGVNATTGEIADDAVRADYTLAFGTMKRAHVLQREQCGEVIVLDIGLGEFADPHNDAWTLADNELLADSVPPISWNAHKGTRGRVAIVGGTKGMAGAVVLASQAALRAGAGLVYAHVHADSVLPLQISVPQAIAHELSGETLGEALKSAGAVVVGPGFGRDEHARELLQKLLGVLVDELPGVPVVLDADALTLIGADWPQLKALAESRDVVCTPHVGEFARLVGAPAADSLAERITQAETFVATTGCTLLLKGTPTVVVALQAESAVIIPRGTSVLATGGSGDMLSGMIGTLLAQGALGGDAAAIAAFVHGRAAEIATDQAQSVRGVTLSEVMTAMSAAWRELAAQDRAVPDGTLARLPRVWSDDEA